jgi:hypothetical protein
MALAIHTQDWERATRMRQSAHVPKRGEDSIEYELNSHIHQLCAIEMLRVPTFSAYTTTLRILAQNGYESHDHYISNASHT